jgi:long-chain fatty acid transport protein
MQGTPISVEVLCCRRAGAPDAGRTAKVSDASTIDLGYAHLFIKDATINNTKAQPGGPFTVTVRGDYEGSMDILSVQYTHGF